MLKIIVNGAAGKMGQETVRALQQHPALECIGELGRDDDLTTAMATRQPDVVVDFTLASCAYENARRIIDANVHPVIGTSGLLPEQVAELTERCQAKQLGAIIAPNFSIGAVLMMKYAADAATYYQHAEIIETHHENKLDAPSGTAIKTAEMMATANPNLQYIDNQELIGHPRGAAHNNIAIHAVRLPGFVAHQQVIFGGNGESLTLKHDSIHRSSFMPGVMLCCQKVVELNTLIYGLENIL